MTMKNERAQSFETNTLSVHTSNDSTKKTQIQVVLDELNEHMHDGITSWDMITKHHITRTAAYICILKKQGYNIVSELETNNGKNYSRYWLLEDEEEDEEDDAEDEDDTDALIEEIWEATGKWVTPAQLEARERYEAHGTWRNTRGW